MLEYLIDEQLLLDTGNDLHGCTNAVGAGSTGTVTLDWLRLRTPGKPIIYIEYSVLTLLRRDMW